MTQVKANLAKIIKSNHISILELDEHLDTISCGLRDTINAELASYGLEVPEFYVSNIVTPDDDENFRRMKQHANLYLETCEEEIHKAEAEVAFKRKRNCIQPTKSADRLYKSQAADGLAFLHYFA